MPEAPVPDPASNTSATDHPHLSGVEGLKKMSLTAGLGSGDYAAVNTLSVVALMASVLGGLAFLDDAFLIVPVIGLVCAIAAFKQISTSNGTQTGRMLVLGAVVLSLGVIGIVGGGKVMRYLANKPDQQKIAAQIEALNKEMGSRNYAAAYKLSSPGFQSRFTEKEFIEPFVAFEAIAEYGGISGVSWNESIEFEEDKQSGVKIAYVGGRFHFRNAQTPIHVPIGFLKVGDQWLLNDLPSIFKPKKQPTAP